MRLDPRDAVEDAEFLNVTAWQGGGSVLDPLEQVGPGVYRTTKPIPVHGGWKSMLRVQQRRRARLDADLHAAGPAIPAPEVPANASFTRAFQSDKSSSSASARRACHRLLTTIAYLTVLAIALALIALIAWSLLRVDRGEGRPSRAGQGTSSGRQCELVRNRMKGMARAVEQIC